MRRTKTILALLAVMAAMLVAFATPALADDRRDNDRYFFGDREQEAESGDVDQDFDVSQTGDNSNQTVYPWGGQHRQRPEPDRRSRRLRR